MAKFNQRTHRNEYFAQYRAEQLGKGFKIQSYWIHVSIIEDVRAYIKSRTSELNLK